MPISPFSAAGLGSACVLHMELIGDILFCHYLPKDFSLDRLISIVFPFLLLLQKKLFFFFLLLAQ